MVNSNPVVNTHLFAFHSCLYANDIAYNAIKFLKPYIKDKDKETQKIYKALEKRADSYYKCVMDVIKDYVYFFADYNSKMDDLNDENIQILSKRIKDIYTDANIEDSEFLAKTETARSIVMLSVYLIESTNDKLKKVGIPVPNLSYYSIQEINRVMENFSKWVNRRNPCVVNVGKDSDVMKVFDDITKALASYKNFEEAWYYAIEQEKKRNENESKSKENW
jgi:hypothetical protein